MIIIIQSISLKTFQAAEEISEVNDKIMERAFYKNLSLESFKVACRVEVWKKIFVKIVKGFIKNETMFMYILCIFKKKQHYFKPI